VLTEVPSADYKRSPFHLALNVVGHPIQLQHKTLIHVYMPNLKTIHQRLKQWCGEGGHQLSSQK
jgi:hypothetical protein